MILSKKYSIMIGVGLALALTVGCGSGASDDTKNAGGDTSAPTAEDNNTTPNHENNSSGIVTYEQSSGVLFEKIDSNNHLIWVNTTDDGVCKISRATSRTSTAYADAQEHCQNLVYAGLSNWRVPTIEEAKSLMKLENKSILLFPASNPNCAIMITNTENTFVYTTSDWNIRDGHVAGSQFTDVARNNKTAGIRCVSTVQ